MFYDRIVISGCIRFSVSGRNYIEVRPTAKVQMILGTNGSGKSTLAELGFSPLAIESRFMEEGGYFIKEGTYKGDRFYLEGRYGKKNSFTFKKNDEVLLEDGTVSNYTDLVRIHLGYTKWLHELLTGTTKFTNLSPQQRQDLLSKIARTDFTQAFKMLAAFKKEFQYHVNVKKFVQNRINEETVKLLTKEDHIVLTERKETLTLEYSELQSIQIPDPTSTSERADDVYGRFMNKLDAFINSQPQTPQAGSEEELDHEIDKAYQVINQLTGQLELVNEEIQQVQQRLGVLTASDSDLTSKRDELRQLEQEIKTLTFSHRDIPEEYLSEDPTEAINALLYHLGSLPSERPDPEKYLGLQRAVYEKETFLHKCEMTVEQIDKELKLYAGIETVSCPSCHHVFKPGVNPADIDKLTERHGKGIVIVQDTENALKELRDRLDDMEVRKSQYDGLNLSRDSYIVKNPLLFRYIDSIGGLMKGCELITPLQGFQKAYLLNHRKQVVQNKIERLKILVEEFDVQNKQRKDLDDQLTTRSKTLNGLLDKRNKLLERQRSLLADKESMLEEERNLIELTNLSKHFNQVLDAELMEIKRRVKKEELERVLTSLSVINTTFNEQNLIEKQIEDFRQQLETHTRKAKLLGEIVSTLSPKTGFIAEQISLSIGNLLIGLNQLFDKVWGYPLEIKLGQIGENGLDYKFPLQDSVMTRDDVSEGSTGMVEMVNRAFAIMSYFTMDLQDIPLFLDEPGMTFDKIHQLNLIPLIRDLTDNVRFSQIVLISHHEDVQTAFPNSETIILDERNIDYPHPYNGHVNFTQVTSHD